MLMAMFTLGFLMYICLRLGGFGKLWDWICTMSICVIYFTHPTLSRAVMTIYICNELDDG